jgi:hypothetical protein
MALEWELLEEVHPIDRLHEYLLTPFRFPILGTPDSNNVQPSGRRLDAKAWLALLISV